ncbi:hypothetical protein Y032_0293g1619 [Ancylostoma ceylanicum]|uniref:Uncharacterized protein n=1 Tax=Ancylostoma ceylanicum TaxID=53326 RepID=A0A016S5E6_9BILA|nr:hypothetical protein Y032_0293g1619 [Ancylostoma ceylanicum]
MIRQHKDNLYWMRACVRCKKSFGKVFHRLRSVWCVRHERDSCAAVENSAEVTNRAFLLRRGCAGVSIVHVVVRVTHART